MTVTQFIVAYAVIGIVAGIATATRMVLVDQIDEGSAGAAGFFVACFWPVVGVVIGLGMAAHWLAQRLRP